jgi:hypothetical protein
LNKLYGGKTDEFRTLKLEKTFYGSQLHLVADDISLCCFSNLDSTNNFLTMA